MIRISTLFAYLISLKEWLRVLNFSSKNQIFRFERNRCQLFLLYIRAHPFPESLNNKCNWIFQWKSISSCQIVCMRMYCAMPNRRRSYKRVPISRIRRIRGISFFFFSLLFRNNRLYIRALCSTIHPLTVGTLRTNAFRKRDESFKTCLINK